MYAHIARRLAKTFEISTNCCLLFSPCFLYNYYIYIAHRRSGESLLQTVSSLRVWAVKVGIITAEERESRSAEEE